MTARVPGVGGTLLPERYVAVQLCADTTWASAGRPRAGTADRLLAWWRRVSRVCGPASPLRVLCDELAMPLLALLDFSAHEVTFDGHVCHARLRTRAGTPVALVLTHWAARPSSRWADVARQAHRIGAGWGLVLTPPFMSVVPTHGHATRRSVDLTLPVVVQPASVAQMLAVAHASRFDPVAPGQQTTHLARVLARAAVFQDRVRADLQHGVHTSLQALTPAFVYAERSRRPKRWRTADNAASLSHFDQALTLVYRILFLLFAESRQLVPTEAPIYRDSYAVSHFCLEAARGAGTGLWDALAATSRLSRLGCEASDLRMTGFNGALFARSSAPLLELPRRRAGRAAADVRDDAVRRALIALGSRAGRGGVERINYRDLGVEQLGAVYERVLDLDPSATRVVPPPTGRGSRHSRLRRQTGTFYTPQAVAAFVVRRTLAPLVDGAASDDILNLRVLDPSMGSGAFLVAACRYLAGAYEDALVAEGQLSPEDVDDQARAVMRRQIAERCLAGVDRNGTAVHLARLSLWLATLAHGRPLGFLDHRLRVGDSLVGAWPGDLQRVSRRARRAPVPLPLFDWDRLDGDVHAALQPLMLLLDRPDDTVSDVRAKEAAWRRFLSATSPLHRWRVAANIWCARWFADAGSNPPGDAETRALLAALTSADGTLPAAHLSRRVREAAATAERHDFFHWPLEFPDVFYGFYGGDRSPRPPGFDAVIGNPPWDVLRREDGDTQGRSRALLRYVRQSGQYPSCVEGHLNLYQAFVDRTLALVRPKGRIGLVLPWSLATDDGSTQLRRRLLGQTAVDTWIGLDNGLGLFPIHRGLRFAVVTATTGESTGRLRAAFGIRTGDQLDALPARPDRDTTPIALRPDDLEAASGPAWRVPDLRRAGDLELLLSLNHRFPRLGSADGWNVTFGRELNATEAGPHLRNPGDGNVPVLEGKHLTPFLVDTRRALTMTRATLDAMLEPGRFDHPRLGYRDVSGVGNRLTLVAAVVPAGVATTHTILCVRSRLDGVRQHLLCALFNSFVLNFVVRLLMGSHVTTTLAAALPVPIWSGSNVERRIAALARTAASGRATPGTEIRLQALVARHYGLSAGELWYVLEGVSWMPPEQRQAVMEQFDAPWRDGPPRGRRVRTSNQTRR